MIITTLSNGERGSLVVAGWPSWLTAVAAEAIAGWIPCKADSFHKLDKAGISHFLIPFFYNINILTYNTKLLQIGQGTYTTVYSARDLQTNKIVALKKVKFANMDPQSVRFMAREIILLRRLHHPNVIKLEDHNFNPFCYLVPYF